MPGKLACTCVELPFTISVISAMAGTFVSFDVVARYLRFLGYKLKYVRNITDIDDKIIKAR